MKIFNNKYKQAQLWLNARKAREEKKLAFQVIVEPQESIVLNGNNQSYVPQVVFSQADIGHNTDEANKIKKIYDELKEIVSREFISRQKNVAV